jgi:hypothetical protein
VRIEKILGRGTLLPAEKPQGSARGIEGLEDTQHVACFSEAPLHLAKRIAKSRSKYGKSGLHPRVRRAVEDIGANFPELAPTMPGRLHTLLHEHAADQFGYITTRDAEDLGVDAHRLQKMKDRGVLTRVGRGLFRFDDVPAGPLDQYAEATLWPLEVQGVLSHATALDLHGLCDINPTRIDITVPRGFRTTRTPAELLRLHREELDERDVTWHEGLPIVGVHRAVLGAIDQHVGWNLIEQAIGNARRTGRVTEEQADELRALRPGGTQATVGA